ncbi:hypothetical protein BGW42_000546 [Actinomortierella wolfii]|nr:hypothetical protein BGW42_000546 [Actinomortierella wolfii]
MDVERLRVLERISTIVTDHRQYNDRLPSELANAFSIRYHGHVNATLPNDNDETATLASTAVALTKQEIVLVKTIVNHAMNMLNKWSAFFQNSDANSKGENETGSSGASTVASSGRGHGLATATKQGSAHTVATKASTTLTRKTRADRMGASSTATTATRTAGVSTTRTRQAVQTSDSVSARSTSKSRSTLNASSIFNTADPTYDHVLILVDIGFIALQILERLDLNASKGFLDVHKARSNLVNKIISLGMKKRGMQELAIMRTQLLKAVELLWPKDKLAEQQSAAPLEAAHHAQIDPVIASILSSHQDLFCFPVPPALENTLTAEDMLSSTSASADQLQTFILLVNGLHNNAIRCWMDVRQGALTHYLDILLQQPGMPATWCSLLTRLNPKASLGPLDAMLRLHFQAAEKISGLLIADAEQHAFGIRMLGVQYLALQSLVPGGRGQEAMWKTMLSCGNQLQTKTPVKSATATASSILAKFRQLLESIRSNVTLDTQVPAFKHWRQYIDTLSSKAVNPDLAKDIINIVDPPKQDDKIDVADGEQITESQLSTPSPPASEGSDTNSVDFATALSVAVGAARKLESACSGRLKGDVSATEFEASCQDVMGSLSVLERCISTDQKLLDLKALQNIARIFQSMDCIWSLASKSFDKSNLQRRQIASTTADEMHVDTEVENKSLDANMFFVHSVKPVLELMSRLTSPLWQCCRTVYLSTQPHHQRLLPPPSKLSSACVDSLLFLFRLASSNPLDVNGPQQAAHYLDAAHTIAMEMSDWESMRWISNAMYNLGGSLFKQGQYEKAAVQIDSCIQCFLTWLQSDATVGMTEQAMNEARITLAKRYEILGICYSTQNDHKASMEALELGLCTLPLEEYNRLQGLLITGHTNHSQLPLVAQLLDRRTRILLFDLVRFDSFANSMAIGDLSPAPTLETLGLIQEFESSVLQLLSVKADCRPMYLQLLQSLAEKTYRADKRIQFPIRRARVLITLASLLQSSTDEKLRSKAVDHASEAVEILKTKELASDADLRNYQSHYLALAYTWFGILQQKLDGVSQKAKPFQIALQLWESILADIDCFTTMAEAATEANRLKTQAASMMIADKEQLMCHLHLLADYLGMIGHQVMQVHVYMLILKLSNSAAVDDPRNCCVDAVRTYIKISQAYLALGYSGKAKLALDQGKVILDEMKREDEGGVSSKEGAHNGQGELYASWLLAYSLYMSSLGHKKQGIQAYNEATMYSTGQDVLLSNPHSWSHSGTTHTDRRPMDLPLSRSTELKVRKTMIIAEASLARSYLQYNEGNLSEAIPDAMRSLRQLSSIVTTLVKAAERASINGPVKRELENPFLSTDNSSNVSGTGYQPQGTGAAKRPGSQPNSQLQKELEVLAHQRHQWQVFRMLIETFHHLARLYLSQGCAREAEYFLQEGKAVAKLSRASWLVDRLMLKQAQFTLRKHEWEETQGILKSLTQRDDHTTLALDLQDACVQLCFGDLYHQTANLERSLRAYTRTDEILTNLMDKEFISKLEHMVIKEPQTPREKKLTHQVRTRPQKGSLPPQKSSAQYECMIMSRMKAKCGYRKALIQGETLQRAEAARTIEDACQAHPMADKSIEYHHVKAKVLMMELQNLMSKHIILAMVPESVLGVGLVRRFVNLTTEGGSASSLLAGNSPLASASSSSPTLGKRITRSARGSSRLKTNASTERQDGYIQVLEQAKWHLSQAYRLAIKGSPPHIVSDICTRQAFLSLMESCLHQDLFKGTNPILTGGMDLDSLSLSPSAFVSPSRPTNVSTKEAIDQHYRQLASKTSFFLELSKGITQRRELYSMIHNKLYPTLPQEDFTWPSAIMPPYQHRARLEAAQDDEDYSMQSDSSEPSVRIPGTRAKLFLRPKSSNNAFATTSEQKSFLRKLEQAYDMEQELYAAGQLPTTPSANPFAINKSSAPLSASYTARHGGDFEPSEQFLTDFVDILPSSWTVVSLSMDVERDILYVNRLRAHTMPVILQLPLSRVKQRAADHPEPLTYELALAELEDILKTSNETLQVGQSFVTREEKLAWWEARKELDERMQNLLQVMQNHWFCGLQGVIQSHNTPKDEQNLLQFKASMERMMFLAAHGQPLPASVTNLNSSTSGAWPPEIPSTRKAVRPIRSTASKLATMSRDAQDQDKTLFLEIDKEICRLILNLGDQPAIDDLEDVIYFLLDAYQHHGAAFEYAEIDFSQLAALIQQALVVYWMAETQLGNDGFDDGAHVILILDKHLQMFPWENLPVLRGEAVSRLPSIWFLRDRILRNQVISESSTTTATAAIAEAAVLSITSSSLLEDEDIARQGETTPVNAWRDLEVDPSSAYYILNPGGDLVHTEQTFKEYVESQRGWDGVIGRRPLDMECVKGLSQSEMYIYFGHSGGEQYIKSHQIRQLLPTRCAVSLLLGCSSGVLTSKGEFDPYGNVLNYILAGCPTIVANLWDVTDKDIDRFSKAMFTAWGLDKNRTTAAATTTTADTPEEEQQQRLSIVEAVKVARGECKLPYLVGAAPVVYGIPCFLKQ